MKNTDLTTRIDSCQNLISLIEKEEQSLRHSLAKRKLNYKGRYTNLIGYKAFFTDHDLIPQASNLDADLTILEKAIGKRELKGGFNNA